MAYLRESGCSGNHRRTGVGRALLCAVFIASVSMPALPSAAPDRAGDPFAEFMSPVTNPVNFEDPRATTEVRPMYPADVCAALERAGFEILVSAPSKGEAWPLCEQKRDLIHAGRRVVRALEAIRVVCLDGSKNHSISFNKVGKPGRMPKKRNLPI